MNWNKISPLFSRKYYLVSTYFLLASLLFLFLDLNEPKIDSDYDLIEIKGRYLTHSFTYKKGKNRSYEYYLWIENYANPFKIKADFINYQIKNEFEPNIKVGENLNLKVPKVDSCKLNKGEYIFLYALATNDKTYLDSKESISKHNNPLLKIMSIGFMLVSILYFVFKKRSLDKK